MKKGLLFVLLFVSIAVYGNSNDSLKIVTLQREVSNLKVSVSRLQQENRNIRGMYQQQKTEGDSLKIKMGNQEQITDSIAQKFDSDLANTNNMIDGTASQLSKISFVYFIIGICGLLLIATIAFVLHYFLRKRINISSSAIDKIKSAQESLETAQKAMQEESIKLDNKLVELLEKQLNQNPETKPDHSFVLDIANEIARIEQNLAFMDTKVKGVSNLKNRASAINDRLKSKGYEIPKLVGEKYIDGNNMKPTMELDEDLPAGTQIIRRVLKPMVLYKGEMIQAAEVVVAYNE